MTDTSKEAINRAISSLRRNDRLLSASLIEALAAERDATTERAEKAEAEAKRLEAACFNQGVALDQADELEEYFRARVAALEGAFNYLMDRMAEVRDLRGRKAATGFPVGVHTDAGFVEHMERIAAVAIDNASALSAAPAPSNKEGE